MIELTYSEDQLKLLLNSNLIDQDFAKKTRKKYENEVVIKRTNAAGLLSECKHNLIAKTKRNID